MATTHNNDSGAPGNRGRAARAPSLGPVTLGPTRRLNTAASARASGCAMGAAIGDALGAPFEFGPAGAFSKRYPDPVLGGLGEMQGGGSFGWAAGEFTDDTQMAIALAESLIENNGFSPEDLWARWRTWAETAADVGITTSAALRSVVHQGAAASAHHEVGRSGGNGATMRVWPIGIAAAAREDGAALVRRVAYAQGALTHFEVDAAWGAVLVAETIRGLIVGESLDDALDAAVGLLTPAAAELFGDLVSADWRPGTHGAPSNGSVWGCVAQAVWAVRSADDFAGALRLAIDLGGDTDTVASVAGALAGARYGVQAIPSRWATYVHGRLQAGGSEATYRRAELLRLSRALSGGSAPRQAEWEDSAGPTEVADRLLAASLPGAAEFVAAGGAALDEYAVLSLCRVDGAFDEVPVRREVHLYDNNGNDRLGVVVADCVDTIDAWLEEGRRVIVHCHGGRSRTALILKAWFMRANGAEHSAAQAWLRERWPRMEEWTTSFNDFLEHDWMDS